MRRRFESCRGRRPVLRANLRSQVAGVAAAIVEGDCDIDGAVGRLVDDVELEGVEERPQFALGRRVERGGEDRQAVEQRGDVGQRGRLRRRGSGERHEALAPFGDGVLKLGHALADAATERGGDVVGFEVDELAGEPPLEIGDLGFDLLGSLLGWRGALRFGRSIEAGAPVVGAFGTEQSG
ncbi:MAG: hypothetical protein M0Z95_29135 [Actinomycetota bacterium]|nr:hypothetical protein [Actinomycetota bacterium]